jgi:hypothetical protein
MYGLGHIADIRQVGDVANSHWLVSDFGTVELPPRLRAEIERIDAHLTHQLKAVLPQQFVNGQPLAMEDLADAQSQAA